MCGGSPIPDYKLAMERIKKLEDDKKKHGSVWIEMDHRAIEVPKVGNCESDYFNNYLRSY